MKIREMLFLAATVATSSLIGAEVRAADQELTPVCSAPNKSGGYVLDLGEYRGFFGMEALWEGISKTYQCPAKTPCRCDLLPGQIPNGPWKLAFTGAGTSNLKTPFFSVELQFEKGFLREFKPTHPQLISRQENRIVLSSCALRRVQLSKGNAEWGIENWHLVNAEMREAWRRGQSYETNFIVDVPNNISGPKGLEPLTVTTGVDSFFEIPTFMERDPCHNRGVQHK